MSFIFILIFIECAAFMCARIQQGPMYFFFFLLDKNVAQSDFSLGGMNPVWIYYEIATQKLYAIPLNFDIVLGVSLYSF